MYIFDEAKPLQPASAASLQQGSPQNKSTPIPNVSISTTAPPSGKNAKLAAIAIIVIAAIIIIGVIAILLPNQLYTTTTSTSTTISPPLQVIPINASMVLFGLPNESNYVPVKNNTWTSVDASKNFSNSNSNYALPFIVPTVSPGRIALINHSLVYTSAYANYTAPLSVDLIIYNTNTISTATTLYTNFLGTFKLIPKVSYMTPYGNYTSNTTGALRIVSNITYYNTSNYSSFSFVKHGMYNDTAVVAYQFTLFKHFFIMVYSFGVENHYNLSYVRGITNNTVRILDGYQ